MESLEYKQKILFVDDEKNILEAYRRLLKNDFRVSIMQGVNEAIELVKNNHFAVIVADYHMPEMDGVKFLTKVKKISPDTIRIILTGKTDLKVAMEAVNIGQVFRFLTKPCEKEELTFALRTALGEYELSLLQKKKQKQDEYLALHDALTGLTNRLYLIERLKQAIALAKRTKTIIGVLFMDLDGFKQINDQKGHDIGDLVLIEVARKLKGSVREIDTVSRHGGDEFVIILQNINNKKDIEMLANRILESLNQPLKINNEDLNLGISIGISLFPHNGEDSNKLIHLADEAMYQAKNKGGMQYYFI